MARPFHNLLTYQIAHDLEQATLTVMNSGGSIMLREVFPRNREARQSRWDIQALLQSSESVLNHFSDKKVFFMSLFFIFCSNSEEICTQTMRPTLFGNTPLRQRRSVQQNNVFHDDWLLCFARYYMNLYKMQELLSLIEVNNQKEVQKIYNHLVYKKN